MEKKFTAHGEHLWPVKLYLDDIETLIEILKEASDDVTLETAEYRFESLAELASKKLGQINELTIKTHNPYVSVGLMSDSLWLYIGEDSIESKGVFEKLKQFLKMRRHKLWFILERSFLMGGIMGLIAGYLIPSIKSFSSGITVANTFNLAITSFLLIFCIVVFLLAASQRLRRYSTIILKPRIEQPHFWQRNRDRLIVGLLVSIPSVLIGAILTYLITSSTK